MREQFKRLQLTRVRLVELDAAHSLPFGVEFNRILVDAPCSGTGTLARHPEIRWRLQPEQLKEFHALQIALLQSALHQLAPGGRLVYSTCSMEPEENEQIVEEALRGASHLRRIASDDFAHGNLKDQIVPAVAPESLFDHQGYFRTTPGPLETDGFFAAIITKS